MPGPVVVPKLLTIDELAERLGVTRRHVRRLVQERKVPFLKVGKFVRFDPAAIAAWLGSQRVPTSGDLATSAPGSEAATRLGPGRNEVDQ